MTEKKKLLIVAGCMNMGGLENQLIHLAANLDQGKYAIDFTSDQKNCDYKETIQRSGWGYIYLPAKSEIGFVGYCRRLYRLLKDNQYDIVHSHELFHSGIVMFIAWLAGINKRISHSHSTNDDSTLHNSLLKALYHLVMRFLVNAFSTDCIGCSSEAAKFLFGRKAIKRDNMYIIVNSVDAIPFLPDELGKQNSDGHIVGHVGRFADVKNQQFIVRIAKECERQHLDIHFILVGDGPTFMNVQTMADNLRTSNYLEFLGMRTDIPDILKKCNAFILPSKFEGMPLSLIEAQAAGLPCVISDHITAEVDFGIGLLHRVSLKASEKVWVDELKIALNQERPSKQDIIEAIHKLGFDNSDYARKISGVYEKRSYRKGKRA